MRINISFVTISSSTSLNDDDDGDDGDAEPSLIISVNSDLVMDRLTNPQLQTTSSNVMYPLLPLSKYPNTSSSNAFVNP